MSLTRVEIGMRGTIAECPRLQSLERYTSRSRRRLPEETVNLIAAKLGQVPCIVNT
jgi:hypothetical protein